MEFQIASSSTDSQLRQFRDELVAQDPAAMVDRDALGQGLRVSTQLSGGELLMAARQGGLQLSPEQILPQPSVCCGGCGG